LGFIVGRRLGLFSWRLMRGCGGVVEGVIVSSFSCDLIGLFSCG
jgi:hypothetical protein